MSQSSGAIRLASRLDPTAAAIIQRVVSRVGAYREETLVEDIAGALATPGTRSAFCVHIGDLNQALADPAYVDVLASGTYLYADGNSVRLLSRLQGRPLPERLVTTDVVWPILRQAAAGGHPVFLLGGPEGLAESAARTMRERILDLQVVGCASGYFEPAEAAAVALRVRASRAHLLVVATGVPHQQRFCQDFGVATGARVLLTAGGLFGYMAGSEVRAPAWMRAAGFEWAWRLGQDPRRLAGRYGRGVLTCARLGRAAIILRGT